MPYYAYQSVSLELTAKEIYKYQKSYCIVDYRMIFSVLGLKAKLENRAKRLSTAAAPAKK